MNLSSLNDRVNRAVSVGSQHLAAVVHKYGTGGASSTIIEIIEEGLKAEQEEKDEARLQERGSLAKHNPAVTDIDNCPKRIWKSLQNHEVTDPFTTDSLINFGVGHAIEDWMCRLLEFAGAEVRREIKVTIDDDDPVITGRLDILALWPELRILAELKSTSSRALKWMLSRGEPGRAEHRKQLNHYLHATHLHPELLDGTYDSGYLIYVVKDATKGEPAVHAWAVDYDQDEAMMNSNYLRNIARLETEPPIPQGYTRSKYPCTYCPFRKACWE